MSLIIDFPGGGTTEPSSGGGTTDTYPSLTVSTLTGSTNLLGANITSLNKVEYTNNVATFQGPERLTVQLDKGSGAYAMTSGCLIHIVLEKI